MRDEVAHELEALRTRAAGEEAKRQAAVDRGDVEAVRVAEIELSRLHARYRDLEGMAA